MKNPINVLFIRDHLERTGGTTYLLETLPRFDPREVRASICVLQPQSASSGIVEQLGLPVSFLNRAIRDPRRLVDLNCIVKASHADVMHLLGPKSFLYGRLIGRHHRIPAIPHFHSLIPDPPLMALLQRRMASWTGAALAPSLAARDWAVGAYNIPPERITVMYYGHDVSRFATVTAEQVIRVKRELDISDEADMIALIGRVQIDQKGQDVMLRLMPELLKQLPQVVLVVVGEGPDLEYCRQLAQQLNITSAIRFTGYREDIPQIMGAANVAVIPSVCEDNFPFVALEAAAAGLPVVAFNSGGIPEAVMHGKTGTIVPKGDAGLMSEALVQLLTNPRLSQRLADNGRAYAAGFSMEAHIHGLTRVYQQVIAQGKLCKL